MPRMVCGKRELWSPRVGGPETDADTIVALMDAVARVDSINVRLTNYTRHGSACPQRRALEQRHARATSPLALTG